MGNKKHLICRKNHVTCEAFFFFFFKKSEHLWFNTGGEMSGPKIQQYTHTSTCDAEYIYIVVDSDHRGEET